MCEVLQTVVVRRQEEGRDTAPVGCGRDAVQSERFVRIGLEAAAAVVDAQRPERIDRYILEGEREPAGGSRSGLDVVARL